MTQLSLFNKTVLLILMAAGLTFLGACIPREIPATPTRSPVATLTLSPSSTTVPTTTPTLTPQPTISPTSLPISPMPTGPRLKDLPVISNENVAGLENVASVRLNESDQVAWSPSGNAFAISAPSGMDVYRLDSFSTPISIRYQSPPYFSSDGTYLAIRLENGKVQVWDLNNGKMQGEYSGLTGEVVYMTFSPWNDQLAAVSVNNQMLIWDMTSGDIRTSVQIPEFVIPIIYTYDLLFSPDQTQIALFREGEALLWEIGVSAEPRRLYWLPPPASPVHGPYQFSPDWQVLAWSDRGNILIMDTTSGATLAQFERQVGAPFVFTHDWESLVVIGYNDSVISVWNPLNGEALQLLEHPETVFSFWLSPDERYLASLTFEGRVTLWDLMGGSSLAELTNEDQAGEWLAFSPQGDRLALMPSDGSLSMWDVADAVQIFTLQNQTPGTSLFSSDGSLLVTLTALDGLRFWDAKTGAQMLALGQEDIKVDVAPSFVYGGKLLVNQTANELQLWGVP